jgi:hypothetical protein
VRWLMALSRRKNKELAELRDRGGYPRRNEKFCSGKIL